VNRRGFLHCCGAPLAAYLAPPRFERPDAASDEGGLWAFMDRAEARIKGSPRLISDPALNAYVSGIACRLAGEHCADLRVYLLRTPHFNAWMSPNGMMQIWSGLLLRMSNEAQLAAMIAHEIGHYLERHALERLRDGRSRSALGQLVSIVLSPLALASGASLGTVALGSAAHVGLATDGLAYARDHERDADRIGVELMARAGYAPIEAARVWTQLREERQAGGAAEPGLLFATHPPAEERERTLREIALGKEGVVGKEAYRSALARHRALFLRDEVQRRRFGETMALLERLQGEGPGDGELWFFRGEARRLRGEAGDLEAALQAYRTALELGGAPPELHRSMGLALRRLGKPAEASAAFMRYLELAPLSPDAELLRTYL
jgi:predicted Zn-dependent protease